MLRIQACKRHDCRCKRLISEGRIGTRRLLVALENAGGEIVKAKEIWEANGYGDENLE